MNIKQWLLWQPNITYYYITMLHVFESFLYRYSLNLCNGMNILNSHVLKMMLVLT